MNKTDIVDVTDKWEAKTAGLHEVIRVDFIAGQDEPLFCILRDNEGDLLTTRCSANGGFYNLNPNHGLDLIPKKPAPTPLERILPFADHWWRAHENDTSACRMTSIGHKDARIDGISWELASVCNFQHSPSPLGPWESVP